MTSELSGTILEAEGERERAEPSKGIQDFHGPCDDEGQEI